uniref:Uncharacterized protein n=1 Tax=Anguilla anguilla TaxID=7936 RepID=A0A0E9QSX8_ANGAN
MIPLLDLDFLVLADRVRAAPTQLCMKYQCG